MAPRFAYVADDFTGASDTLATLSRAGLSARLFLRIDDAVEAARNQSIDAVGVATPLRAMRAAQARALIRDIAPGIAALEARYVHFKICSTFDSSAGVGNVCAAADVLADAIGADWTAIIGGQPSLGRYCLFGNLFAAGGDGAVHRIDRHPTMSVHPVTPMAEADLRRHFAALGWDGVGLVDGRAYAGGGVALKAIIEARLARGETHVLFDVGQQGDLAVIGDALTALAPERQGLMIGASGVVEALFHGHVSAVARPPALEGPVFAFAGSRSVVTARQVANSTRYLVLPLEPDDALSGSVRVRGLAETCRTHIRAGDHVLVRLSASPNEAGGQALAAATGAFIKEVVDGARPGCLAIAGGDTSSAAIEAIGVDSLSFMADIDPGVPLVRAHGRPAVDGLPMILKGGQVGRPGLFDALAELSGR